MSSRQTKLFVIDGLAQVYRSYYAIGGLNAPDGTPTNVIYGFLSSLFKLLREEAMDYLIVAMDRPGKTFRHKMYSEYKANRKPMEPDCAKQIPILLDLLNEIHVAVVSQEDYEADDVMGTLARQFSAKGMEVILVSGDKDLKQLISDKVCMRDFKSRRYYAPKDLKAEMGITPDQMIEVMGLAGDTSDNIPGIPGVGMKTAMDLISRFSCIEEVYNHLDEITGPKRREKIAANRDKALLSRDLASIRCDLPLDVQLKDIAVGQINPAAAGAAINKLGLARLMGQFQKTNAESSTCDYRLVNTLEKLDALVGELGKQKRLAVDTETTSILPVSAELVGISFSFKPHSGYYIPVQGPEGAQVLEKNLVLEKLRPILENPNIEKIGQNIKYDYIVLCRAGVHMKGLAFDTMLASYLLSAGRRRHGLDALALEELGVQPIALKDLIGTGKKQIKMNEVALDKVTPYAAEDADLTLQLMEKFQPRLAELGLARLFCDLEMPLVRVLGDMEMTGITVEPAHLDKMALKLQQMINSLEARIYEEAGEVFHIASTKQLQQILFQKLSLPVVKKTKTGASTDSTVLEKLSSLHPVPQLILEYRQLEKLMSTYVTALPKMIHPETGRIHASFNQTVTATGRLSSSDPNLQNIPIREDLGREIRRAFVVSANDRSLISADYSQIELRLLAHLSQDPALIQAFTEEDADIHAQVAAEIFDVPLDAVDTNMRQEAKAVNFGIIYGQSSYGLSQELGIRIEDAKSFIDAYFCRFEKVRIFITKTIEDALESGWVETILGRRREIPGIRSANIRERAFAERAAVNTVVQGSAADLIKLAMLKIHQRHKNENQDAAMLLQIHDELVCEASDELAQTEMQAICDDMASAMQLDVPLAVTAVIGKNWFELKN